MRLSAVQSRITSKSCHRCCWPEATYNANTAECIYVTGAASAFLPFFSFFFFLVCVRVESAAPCMGRENNSIPFWWGEASGRTTGIRDQTNRLQWEQKVEKVAAEEERRWRRGGGGGAGFDGGSLSHTAFGTLRCEGRERQLSPFQSHSCRDPSLHLYYLGCSLSRSVCVFVLASSSSPGDMLLCSHSQISSNNRFHKRSCHTPPANKAKAPTANTGHI